MKRARRKKATTSVVTGERRAAARRERAEEERRPKGRGLGAAVVGSGGSEGEVGGGGLAMAAADELELVLLGKGMPRHAATQVKAAASNADSEPFCIGFFPSCFFVEQLGRQAVKCRRRSGVACGG